MLSYIKSFPYFITPVLEFSKVTIPVDLYSTTQPVWASSGHGEPSQNGHQCSYEERKNRFPLRGSHSKSSSWLNIFRESWRETRQSHYRIDPIKYDLNVGLKSVVPKTFYWWLTMEIRWACYQLVSITIIIVIIHMCVLYIFKCVYYYAIKFLYILWYLNIFDKQ